MELETKVTDGIAVITCRGPLLIGEGDALLRQTVHDLVQNGTARILLDVSGVPRVDKTGLGEIVHAYTAMNRTGGCLVLLGPSLQVRDLLDITKLTTVLTVFGHGEHEQALAHLKERS